MNQVGGGVCLAGGVPPGGVDGCGDGVTEGEAAGFHGGPVNPEFFADFLHVVDSEQTIAQGHGAAVADLAAGFGVEGGGVEDDLNVMACRYFGYFFAVAEQADHVGLGGEFVVADEFGGVVVYPVAVDRQVCVPVFFRLGVGFGAGPLFGHEFVEAFGIDLEPGFGGHFQGEVDGEPVSVVQGEGVRAGNGGFAFLFDFCCRGFEEFGAGFEGFQESGFFGDGDTLDAFPVVSNLGVGGGHGVHDGVHEAFHGFAGGAEEPGGSDDAAEESAQDVAAAFVAGGDAVEDDHHGGAGVVGDDPEPDVVFVVGAVGGAGEALGFVDDGPQEVGFVDVVDALEEAGDSFHAHAGVDVFLR